eukprot:gene3224-8240_t
MEEWRSEIGFHQRSTWRHLDRLHEEVVELDSPFASKFAAGTLVYYNPPLRLKRESFFLTIVFCIPAKADVSNWHFNVYTFMLTGDQNAGKSTFLHAFTDHESESYLPLLSILPVLSSSFINSRFLSPDDTASPRDEGRFLVHDSWQLISPLSSSFCLVSAVYEPNTDVASDTDLCHASVVLTADDFSFFVNEYELDPSLVTQAPKDTIYFAINFIEFGGDHLDRLMSTTKSGNSSIDGIVDQSREALSSCSQIVYFINAQHLLETSSVLENLALRLQYLNDQLLPETRVLVLVTRFEVLELTEEVVSRLIEVFSVVLGPEVTLCTANIQDLLNDGLKKLSNSRSWRFSLERVFL